jgi:hypothetical protein
LKYLKKLRISECGIGSMMVKRIAMSLTQIIDLDLSTYVVELGANGIDKHGANAISEMKGLKFLNLCNWNTIQPIIMWVIREPSNLLPIFRT